VKLSLNWLREYVELPGNITPEQIAFDLTMTTVEVEGFVDLNKAYDKMLVGKVTEIKPHPDADRLKIALVDIGAGEIKEIVCGGSNLDQGMLVLVAEPGAKVRWHGEGDLVELKEAKIRGIKSYGMICASTEVGLSDLFPLEDEHHIMDLSAFDIEPGQNIAEALGLSDVVFEIDNKSLTNRPDLWGHFGIARELAAIYKGSLKPLPSFDLPSNGSGLVVKNTDGSLCRRYTGTLIEGIQKNESPLWLKVRLANVGQRPINLLVDLSNYVMFAVGQPTHVFDAARVSGQEIHVRQAKKGEEMPLLDGSSVKLEPWMPLIADPEKPLALAGVMGGELSGVESNVSTVILEVANFPGTLVRKCSSKLEVRTESSIRFEKNLDSVRVQDAVELFLHTLAKIETGIDVKAFVDSYPSPWKDIQVEVNRDFIVDRVGVELSTAEITELLERLHFQVSQDKDHLVVNVPSWRATGDVSIAVDIVEEVARLYGYDNIAFVPPVVVLDKAVRQPRESLERQIREFLAGAGGMNEVFSYPWIEQKHARAAGEDESVMLRLQDPPSPDTGCLIRSLVPNLLAAVEKNYRNYSSFSLFEIGRVFLKGKGTSAMEQPKMLAAAIVDASPEEVFLRAKGILQSLSSSLSMEPLTFAGEGTFSPWAAGGGALAICSQGKQIGQLALASQKTLSAMDIERVKVAVFELSLAAIEPSMIRYNYKPIPKFPYVKFDLSLVFDEKVSWEKIASLAASSHPAIQSVTFADEYRGEQVEEGKKSIAFQLTLGSSEKTLAAPEVQKIIDNLLKKMQTDLGGTLRSR